MHPDIHLVLCARVVVVAELWPRRVDDPSVLHLALDALAFRVIAVIRIDLGDVRTGVQVFRPVA